MVRVNPKINALARTFSLFQDPLRLHLFLLLAKRGEGGKELCVSALAGESASSVSNTSHQLRKLELAGVVARVRRGRMICYQLRKTPFTSRLYHFFRSSI